MKATRALVVAALVTSALAGCARHVVLDPDDVARLNERRWTVRSEPRVPVLTPSDAGPPR